MLFAAAGLRTWQALPQVGEHRGEMVQQRWPVKQVDLPAHPPGAAACRRAWSWSPIARYWPCVTTTPRAVADKAEVMDAADSLKGGKLPNARVSPRDKSKIAEGERVTTLQVHKLPITLHVGRGTPSNPSF